ncbi:MAG: YggS family pyridoxal phosphate-dependent enzyme [Clostridia bacterium]|nr:YggS family pyridoxal phosphate-dependent enzyme [Clostridia bacterium]
MDIAAVQKNIAHIQSVLEKESAPFGRVPQLIAVTKYLNAEDTLQLASLGITQIGENRVQVIRDKLPLISGKFSMHLIGRLQSNKIKYIIKDVSMIHSVDHMSLLQEIDRQAQMHGTRMDVLLQVNIAGESQKGGAEPHEVLPLLKNAARLPGVHVRGLMTMMPHLAPEDFIVEKFTAMRCLLDQMQAESVANTDMTELSMGMSQDYALAARCGATMVRVGSALTNPLMYESKEVL